VIGADALAKGLMNADAGLKERIASEFGAEVLHEGSLNSSVLGPRVFSDLEKLAKFNGIVHPFIFSKLEPQVRGKKNVVLVAEHPDVTLETDGKTRVVQAKEIGVVSEFPVASDNWYLVDAKYDIPTGKKVDGSDNAARYLWRIEKRVGLVARDCCNYWDDDGRRYVYLNGAPSDGFGVAIEAASGGALKKLQVETADNGIAIKGVTLEEFRALVGKAETNLAEVSQMLRPEKLEAMRLLLQALEIKG
jgi:hypothetical protein